MGDAIDTYYLLKVPTLPYLTLRCDPIVISLKG